MRQRGRGGEEEEQDKVSQMESELRRKLASETVQRAEEGEDERKVPEE